MGDPMNSLFQQISNKNMQYIVALDTHKTISAAAKSLYISQPALSRFLQNLEKDLGFQLFIRANKKLIPTYEGERYLFHAKRILQMESQMEEELQSMLSDSIGRLRIALPSLRSAMILPSILPAFYKCYPNVEIILQEVSSRMIEKLLIDGEVDYAFLNQKSTCPDMVSHVISNDRILLAVSPSHYMYEKGKKDFFIGKYPEIDIKLLKDDLFILQPDDQRTRKAAEEIFEAANISPQILLVTKSIEASLMLVSSGLGVCFVAESYAKHIRVPHPLSFFSILGPYAEVNILLAHMNYLYQPDYSLKFLEIAKENLS